MAVIWRTTLMKPVHEGVLISRPVNQAVVKNNGPELLLQGK